MDVSTFSHVYVWLTRVRVFSELCLLLLRVISVCNVAVCSCVCVGVCILSFHNMRANT